MLPEDLRPARAHININGVECYFRPIDLEMQIFLADKYGGFKKLNQLLGSNKISVMIEIAWELLENKDKSGKAIFEDFGSFKIALVSTNEKLDTEKVMLLTMLIAATIGASRPMIDLLEESEDTKKAIPILKAMLA